MTQQSIYFHFYKLLQCLLSSQLEQGPPVFELFQMDLRQMLQVLAQKKWNMAKIMSKNRNL